MGWFARLFGAGGGPRRVEPDRVWMSRGVCNSGILRDVCAARAAGARVLVIAHFEEALTALLAGDGAAVFGGDMPVLAVDIAGIKGGAGQYQLVIVAERHPLRSEDDAVVAWASGGVPAPKVAFYVALDDALLRAFGGDRTRETLRSLGMKEDEAIQHATINRALRSAQNKMAARAAAGGGVGGGVGARRTGSAAEWLGQIGMVPASQ